jgi:acyl-CoA reductase-like NAD-dependent aldehyde dehydrogenase
MAVQDTAIAFYNIINGRRRATSQRTHRGTDPRSDQPLRPCPVASKDDLDDAVAAARSAFRTWADTDIECRQRALLALANLLVVEKEMVSGIVCRETGKSVRTRAELNCSGLLTLTRMLDAEIHGGVGGRTCG